MNKLSAQEVLEEMRATLLEHLNGVTTHEEVIGLLFTLYTKHSGQKVEDESSN